MNEQETQPEIILSDRAIEYVVATAKPVITLDFVGYLGGVDLKKDKVSFLLDVCGNFQLISSDKDRPVLPRKLKQKWMKRLLKCGFLQQTIEPFPEFSSAHCIPIDPDAAEFYPLKIFKAIYSYDTKTTQEISE